MPRVEEKEYCGLFDAKVVKEQEEEEEGKKKIMKKMKLTKKKKGIVGKISAAAL